jgi:hypothetical protein
MLCILIYTPVACFQPLCGTFSVHCDSSLTTDYYRALKRLKMACFTCTYFRVCINILIFSRRNNPQPNV